MSKILLLALFLVISCNEEKAAAPGSVGENKKYEPLELNDADAQKVRTICSALANKEGVLNILVSNGNEYHFKYAQKNCEDSKMPAMKSVVTSIQGFDPHYSFVPKNGVHFGFQNVETTSNGIMAEICDEVFDGRELKSPMTVRSGAIWFSTTTADEHCKSESKEYCIQIQRGNSSGNNYYKIHTNEWMKVALTGKNKGFFTERKLISSASCPDKKKFEKKAILK